MKENNNFSFSPPDHSKNFSIACTWINAALPYTMLEETQSRGHYTLGHIHICLWVHIWLACPWKSLFAHGNTIQHCGSWELGQCRSILLLIRGLVSSATFCAKSSEISYDILVGSFRFFLLKSCSYPRQGRDTLFKHQPYSNTCFLVEMLWYFPITNTINTTPRINMMAHWLRMPKTQCFTPAPH